MRNLPRQGRFVVGEPDTASEQPMDPGALVRAYTGTTRPAHTASRAWQALQYSEWLKIAAAEAARKAAELVEAEPQAAAVQADNLLSHRGTPIAEADEPGFGSCRVASAVNIDVTPVIIECSCDPESKLGQLKGRCRVIRITKESLTKQRKMDERLQWRS